MSAWNRFAIAICVALSATLLMATAAGATRGAAAGPHHTAVHCNPHYTRIISWMGLKVPTYRHSRYTCTRTRNYQGAVDKRPKFHPTPTVAAPSASVTPTTTSSPSATTTSTMATPSRSTSTAPTSATSSTTALTTSAPTSSAPIRAWLTGYTWHDNDPPGSANIAYPVKHRQAGGTGTFDDPITLAVGSLGEWAKGTRFYIPNLRRYVMVEDLCGSCRQGHPPAKTWIDVWIGGVETSKSVANACAEAITNIWDVIKDPPANLAVTEGPIFNGGCSPQYGNEIVYAS